MRWPVSVAWMHPPVHTYRRARRAPLDAWWLAATWAAATVGGEIATGRDGDPLPRSPLHGPARTEWGTRGVTLAAWLSAHVPPAWQPKGLRLRLAHPSPDPRARIRVMLPHLAHLPAWIARRRKGGVAAGRLAQGRVEARRERLRP